MNKIRKMLFLCSLALVMAFLATACKPDGGTILGGEAHGNVLFGGERPDYDGIFDYKSDYMPQEEPFDPDTILTLTLAENTGVTFAGGSRTAQLKFGDPLPAVVNSKQDLDLVGWYNLDKPNQTWKDSSYPYEMRDDLGGSTANTSVSLQAFSMPTKNITIAPFFEQKGTDRRALIAGSQVFDNVSPDMYINRVGTRLFETNVGVQAGMQLNYGGLTYNGAATGSITPANLHGCFRFQTSCASANTAGLPGLLQVGAHTYYFWFKNLGDEEIKFTARQVISTTNLINGVTTGEITLAPGATWTGSMTVTLTGANNNALTFILLGKDQENAKLGVVMSKSTANQLA